MNWKFTMFCVAVFMASVATTARAQVIKSLCKEADAVVVGAVDSSSRTGDDISATLEVKRNIKGSITIASRVLTSQRHPRDKGSDLLPKGMLAIWFLTKKTGGEWEVIPAAGASGPLFASGFPVPPRKKADGVPPAGGAGNEQVAWELARSARYYAARSHKDAWLYYCSAEALAQVGSTPDLADLWEEFARSASPDLRALSVAHRIRDHDVRGLLELAKDTAVLENSRFAVEIFTSLLEWRSGPPDSVRALGQIAVQSALSPEIRESAAEPLMMIHTPEAVPFLAELLNSNDATLQTKAVRGLSLFVNAVPPLTAGRARAMAYLAQPEKGQYRDVAITPYVAAATPVPKGELKKYVAAWKLWWQRAYPAFVADHPTARQ